MVRCDERKKRTVLNPEEFIDLIDGLDFKKALEEANIADHFLDYAIANAKKGEKEAKDIIKAAEVAKEAWKKIAEDAKKCSEELFLDYIFQQDEIIKIGETIQYYHADKQQLLRELAVHDSHTANVYNKVIRTADDVFNQVLGFKNDLLSAAKLDFHQSYTKMLEAKKSFDCADKDARNCLNVDHVSFQDKGATCALNSSGNDTLYNAFKEKKVDSIRKNKKAQAVEGKFNALLEQLGNSYFSLSNNLPDSCNDVKTQHLFDTIKILWYETKNCAEENQKAWDEATQAVIAAKDLKIAWATNILRLAEHGTGNFDLGEATNREGALLVTLWLGDECKNVKLSDGKECLMSNDELKRVRLLSYKPKERKYMMNFERRVDASSAWEFDTPALSNGHLIIINPHDDYANNNSMSLKFEKLTSLQLQEAYAEKEAEMKMAANILYNRTFKESERFANIRNQAQAADYEGRIAERDKLNSEANIIKQHLGEKIIPQAMEAYQKGLDAAPESQQEWWRNQLDTIKSQAQIINAAWSGGSEELWNEEIRTLRINHAFLKKEIEKNQKAYDVIPELNEKLRAFWRKKVDELDYIKSKQIAIECHYKARQAMDSAVKANTKFFADIDFFTDNEQEWDKVIQNIHSTIPLWDETIERYSNYLAELPEEKSLLCISGKKSLEVVQDGKNQCIASEYLANAQKALFIAARAKMAADSSGQECQNNVMQKQEEAKVAFDCAIVDLQKGLAEVSESRKDLCEWWKKLLSDAQFIKNRFFTNNPMNLMEKVNRAEATANLAYRRAFAAETAELWSDAAQKSKEAKMAYEEASIELEKNFNKTSDMQQDVRVLLNQFLQQGQEKKNYWSALSLMCNASKATVIANLACSRAVAAEATTETVELWSDAAQKSEEVKVAWQKALADWQKALAECEEGPQKVAQLQDWNQRLKFSQDQYNSWSATALQFQTKKDEFLKIKLQQRMQDMKNKRAKK